MTFYTTFTTNFCDIILVGTINAINYLHMDTGEGKRGFAIDDDWVRNDTALSAARNQIEEYCKGTLTRFTIPIRPKGTEFQTAVWKELCRIPYGEVRTYGQIAQSIGNTNACRAVGMANSKNPIPIIIPCHRVIGANGSLTGFAHGLTIKQKLIDFEHKQQTC